MMKAPRFKKKSEFLKYKPAWRIFPLKEIKIKQYINSPSLNVCSGASELCDYQLDLYTESMIRGDMRHLPFKSNYFQTVLCDPPWHMANHLRPKILWELRRVIRVGGNIILRSPWSPKIPRLSIKEVFAHVPRQFWCNVDLYTIYIKNNDLITNYT